MLNQVEGLVNRVVGTDKEVGASTSKFFRRRKHELRDTGPVVGANEAHVAGKRMRVQGDFRVIVVAEPSCAFERDRAVAERGSFGAAGDDADVERHVQSSALSSFFFPFFKSRRIARIVFQLRVVAGTPNNLSIWPR